MRINLEMARRLAAQIVEEAGPGFTYQLNPGTGCYYVPLPTVREWGDRVVSAPQENDPRESTGCLVGRVLDAAGETRHHQFKHSADNVEDLSRAYPELMTRRAVGYLLIVQEAQDAGDSWRTALERAERAIEEEMRWRSDDDE